jgi:hypothetical protein
MKTIFEIVSWYYNNDNNIMIYNTFILLGIGSAFGLILHEEFIIHAELAFWHST